MKLNFRLRLFLYVALAFTLFTLSVILVEQTREKKFKTEAIEEKLDAYTDIVQKTIHNQPVESYPNLLQSLEPLFPQNLRLSIIEPDGKVVYDNDVSGWNSLENHSNRKEIIEAKENKTGTDIRTSHSTQKKYLYYAKNEGNLFVRVALPYDVEVQHFFKSDNVFLYVIILLFLTVLSILNRISNIFSKPIIELRDFALDPKKNTPLNFPKNEIEEIGKEIALNYAKLRDSKEKIELEQEKLLQHIHNSQEGICFFSPQKKAEFYNGLFLQFIHNITDETNADPSVIFSDETFIELQQFLENTEPSFKEYALNKQGKIFSIRIVKFEDHSFEMMINDITKQENLKLLKQQMLSNISHELRTPVTGISGYLETILEKPLDNKTKQHFIHQAFNQTKVLSELIQDMSLINKMDEAGQTLKIEAFNLFSLLEKIREDYSLILKENHAKLLLSIPENTIINANESLIHSVFKNLIDNAIRYAGKEIEISISMYKSDNGFYYFSFYDTGKGIQDEKHLSRIFERFYRVDEGRTRTVGGSGLGLSIVKNAIAIHGGTIIAKNRKEGGLEFLFYLRK